MICTYPGDDGCCSSQIIIQASGFDCFFFNVILRGCQLWWVLLQVHVCTIFLSSTLWFKHFLAEFLFFFFFFLYNSFITNTVAYLGRTFHVNLYSDPGTLIRSPGSGRYLKTLSSRIFWLLSLPRGNATSHEFCSLFCYYVMCVFPCQRPLGATLTWSVWPWAYIYRSMVWLKLTVKETSGPLDCVNHSRGPCMHVLKLNRRCCPDHLRLAVHVDISTDSIGSVCLAWSCSGCFFCAAASTHSISSRSVFESVGEVLKFACDWCRTEDLNWSHGFTACFFCAAASTHSISSRSVFESVGEVLKFAACDWCRTEDLNWSHGFTA